MSRSLKGGYLTLIQIKGHGPKRRRMRKKKGGAGKVIVWTSVCAAALVGFAWLALETGMIESLVRTL
ncbi:MAG: hypothetical protein WDZ84_13410 [Rhodovibrionaceae bacterium]